MTNRRQGYSFACGNSRCCNIFYSKNPSWTEGCGIILCREELGNKIDRAVFPGLQGGPKGDMLAARAVLFKECMTPEFQAYAKQVLANAVALGKGCVDSSVRLVTGGTDTHMVMLDVSELM